MKNTTQLLSMAAAITMMTAPSQAATIWNGNGDGSSWIDGSNWTSGVPSGGEVVTIGSGFTVNAPSTVDLATFDLSLEGTLNFGAGANYSAGGTITVSGNGHLTGVSLAYITPNANGVTPTTTTFNLEGDTAQISNFAQLGSFDSVVDKTVNWNLTPGATGINTIAMTGASWHGFLLNGTDNLTVDLSGYDVINGDNLTLFTYNTLYGDTFESVVINGDALGTLGSGTSTAFDAGDWSGDFVFGANSVSLSNLVAVPEPGTYALISGCLALGAVMLRRRRA
jgi:hypothetical protein